MKHATAEALDRLEPLLDRIRAFGALKEKSRGVFYRGSRAALHFHEDPQGLFADFRGQGDWTRFPVNAEPQCLRLLRAIEKFLAAKQ